MTMSKHTEKNFSDIKQPENIVDYHHNLLSQSDSAYYHFTDGLSDAYHRAALGPDATLTIGPIGSFHSQQIARYIEAQVDAYFKKDVFGSNLLNNQPNREELTKIMATGFSPNDIIVLVEKNDSSGRISCSGGVRAYFGDSHEPVMQSHSSNKPTNLAPLSAIRPAHDTEQLQSFYKTYGQTPYDQIVSMSRLFHNKAETGIEYDDLAWVMMAALAIGTTIHSQKNDSTPMPKLAIYDTHSPKIQQKLEQHFAASIISPSGNNQATAETMSSILRYHYSPNSEGGFGENILLGAIPYSIFVPSALALLKEHGINLYSNPSVQEYLNTQLNPELSQLLDSHPHAILTAIKELKNQENNIIQPEIINHHTDNGLKRISYLTTRANEVSLQPYSVAAHELTEYTHLLKHLPSDPTKLTAYLTNTILELHPELKEQLKSEDINNLLNTNSLITDLSWLIQKSTLHGLDLNTIDQESRYIHYPSQHQLVKYIGPDAHRLLTRSRLLGLIPFKMLDALESARITSAGASAVTSTLFGLAQLGANHITWYDTGRIDPSNLTRFPGGMASILNIGSLKGASLQEICYLANPYGHYQSVNAHLVKDDASKSNPHDITFAEFVERSNLGIEVVDNPAVKTLLRQYLIEHAPRFRVVFLADVNRAFVGIEKGENRNPFHQNILLNVLAAMTAPNLDNLATNHNARDRARLIRHWAFSSVNQMLKHDFPPEHQLQFVVADILGLPWSQTSLAALESADIAIKLILQTLVGLDVSGKNYTAGDVPSQSQPLDKKTQKVLDTITTTMFKLP
jgi:hypothetical protein